MAWHYEMHHRIIWKQGKIYNHGGVVFETKEIGATSNQIKVMIKSQKFLVTGLQRSQNKYEKQKAISFHREKNRKLPSENREVIIAKDIYSFLAPKYSKFSNVCELPTISLWHQERGECQICVKYASNKALLLSIFTILKSLNGILEFIVYIKLQVIFSVLWWLSYERNVSLKCANDVLMLMMQWWCAYKQMMRWLCMSVIFEILEPSDFKRYSTCWVSSTPLSFYLCFFKWTVGWGL